MATSQIEHREQTAEQAQVSRARANGCGDAASSLGMLQDNAPRQQGSAGAAGSPCALQLGKHLLSLDALRGVAILMVMLYHFNHHVKNEPSPAVNLVFSMLRMGGSGVDLFFVLSGFLITGILYDTRHSEGYFRTFYVRRALRIFPLYYGVLLLCTVLLPMVSSAFPYDWKNVFLWTYCTNIAQSITGEFNLFPRFGYFWSLAVEEHFYFVWPLVIYYCSRRQAMVACVVAIAAAFLCRWGLNAVAAQPVVAYTLTPCRMDSLAAGALVALALRGPVSLPVVRSAAWGLLALSGACLAGLFITRRGAAEMDGTVMLWRFLLSSAFFSGLLVLVVHSSPATWWGRLWTNPLLRVFGKYSYGLYVYHSLLRGVWNEWFVPDKLAAACGSVLLAQIAFSLLAGCASLLVASASWHLLERHFVRLKDVLAPQRNRRAEPSVVSPPLLANLEPVVALHPN